MPRGHCLATKGHLFVPWGQLFVLLICYTQIKSSPHISVFLKKKLLKDYEFDDDNKSYELQIDGVVMLKSI
jgi:hypothetical protein